MANQIPKAFIEELLSRIDLVELIEAKTKLKKAGSKHKGLCPFHNEKTPSFSVDPTTNPPHYHCFGCSAHGDALNFVMTTDHLQFPEAVAMLAQRAGMPLPQQHTSQTSQASKQPLYDVLGKTAAFYQRQLQSHSKSEVATQYLQQRGLSPEIIAQFELGFAPPGWDNLLKQVGNNKKALDHLQTAGMLVQKTEHKYYDRFRDRLMFPIHDQQSRIIGFGGRVFGDELPKYLNSPETPLFHKSRELYGLPHVLKANQKLTKIIIVEGYMDVVSLSQFGITNSVATLGTAVTERHVQKLFRFCSELVFCFDGDAAGAKAAWRTLETILAFIKEGRQAHFMFLPQGEDPDSIVRKENVEGFNKRIQSALPLSEYFFAHLTQGVDLRELDQRARIAEMAIPLLEQLPRGVFKQMMLETLAKKVQMDTHTLTRVTQKDKPIPAVKQPKRSNRLSQPSPMRITIALLLQNPSLINDLGDSTWLEKCSLPGSDILREIISILKNTPENDTKDLIKRYSTPKYSSVLEQLANWRLAIPQDGQVAEFKGAIQRLIQNSQEQQTDQLLTRIGDETLTSDEKRELFTLITSLKNIEDKD